MAECNQKVVDTSSSLAVESGDPQAPATTLPDEPYALALDKARGYLYVGHLVGSTSVQDTGGVSLFDVSGTGFIAADEFPAGAEVHRAIRQSIPAQQLRPLRGDGVHAARAAGG